MNDRINNGKGSLKEKLGGYQVDPPDSVWNSISPRLGGRRRRGWVIIAFAAAASVALAVTLGINYFGPGIPRDSGVAELQEGPWQATPERATPERATPERATPERATPERATQIEDPSAYDPAGREPSRTSRRGTMEEKVVSTLESLTPQTAHEISTDMRQQATGIEGPDQSGQPGLAADVRETDVVLPEEVSENADSATTDKRVEKHSPETGETLAELGLADPEEKPVKDPRWVIGAAVSPLYSFRDAEPQALSDVPGYESGMVSYAGGIQVGYKTTRRLAIETGVFFNKMGISIGAPGIQLFPPEYDFAPLGEEAGRSNIMAVTNTVGNIVSKSGDIYVNSYKLNASYDANTLTDNFTSGVNADQGIRQHLDYLEVPLNLRYTLVDRSFEVQLVGGLSTNLLVNNYVTMETPEGTTEIGYLTNIRNVNYSGNAGVGLVYHILDHFSISLEPRFRYFLNSVNDATLPSTRPYTFGLYSGMNYLF